MGQLKLLHLITGLNTGGAEMMLYRLLTATDRAEFAPVVVSLLDRGTLGERIAALGVPVHAVGMRRRYSSAFRLARLRALLRRERPDVIQGWMYHANLAAQLLRRGAGRPRVVWGLHHTTIDPAQDKRATIWVARAGARLSRRADAVVACSESTRRLHETLGYCRDNMRVIPNGFDLTAFAPDPAAPVRLRRELGLPAEAFVVGLVARFDPQKDHRNFLEAARLLLDGLPPEARARVFFALCGRNVDAANARLGAWVAEYDLAAHVRLLGLRDDVPALMAGLDVLSSSSSHGEAFPLVIGEAMACGVPCAVTDVGDSARIVGDTGCVVPPRDPAALAATWASLLEGGPARRRALGRAARRRIQERFSLETVAAAYETLYKNITAAR